MHDVHLDFEAWLTIATFITGILWALERFVWHPKRAEGESPNWFVEFGYSFFPVILIVLVLRSFVVEPFRIPSPSMVPTLLEGDFILVNKFSYGLRLPVLHTEFLDLGEPERGDVAVFRWPKDPSKDFIKRIVGLPGDEIVYDNHQLFIDGEPVKTERLGVYEGENVPEDQRVIEYLEHLGEHDHRKLNVATSRDRRRLQVEVPEGHYFVMGDNRDHSMDSRVWGFVPEHNLVGQAFLIWMSVDTDPIGLRFSRLGNLIE